MNHSTPEFFTYPLLLWICLLSSICVANVFSQFKLFFSFSFKDQNVFISMKSDLLIFFSFTVCVFCVPSKKFWLGFSQGFRDCLLHFLLWLNFCQSSSHKVALLFYFVLRYSRLINNVVIVSGEQQKDSAIHTHVSILPPTPLPSRLPQSIEKSSMCDTVGPCWSSVLNIAVCTCPSQTP